MIYLNWINVNNNYNKNIDTDELRILTLIFYKEQLQNNVRIIKSDSRIINWYKDIKMMLRSFNITLACCTSWNFEEISNRTQ